MNVFEKILDNKTATSLIVLLVVVLIGYFVFFYKPKQKAAAFNPTPPPPDGSAKEGTPNEIVDKAKVLADAIYADLDGPNVYKNVALYKELSNASDTYFVSVYNAFGIRDGENLYDWLLNEFAVLNPIAFFGGFSEERNKILDRIEFLKLRK